MTEFLTSIMPNVMDRLPDFYQAIGDTLIMVGWSGSIAFVLGLFLGIVLTVTKPGGILEQKVVYQVLDKFVNFFRSIPEKSLKHRLLIGRSGFRKFFLFHETDPLRLFLLPAMNLHIILLGPVKDQRKQVRKTHGAAIDCPCFGAVHLLRRIINHPAELRTTPKNQG